MSRSGSVVARLLEKEKARVMKLKLGNERGVMSYCARARPVMAQPLDLLDIQDKPQPKAPVYKERPPLPMKSDWAPRGFGKKRKPIKWAGGVVA